MKSLKFKIFADAGFSLVGLKVPVGGIKVKDGPSGVLGCASCLPASQAFNPLLELSLTEALDRCCECWWNFTRGGQDWWVDETVDSYLEHAQVLKTIPSSFDTAYQLMEQLVRLRFHFPYVSKPSAVRQSLQTSWETHLDELRRNKIREVSASLTFPLEDIVRFYVLRAEREDVEDSEYADAFNLLAEMSSDGEGLVAEFKEKLLVSRRQDSERIIKEAVVADRWVLFSSTDRSLQTLAVELGLFNGSPAQDVLMVPEVVFDDVKNRAGVYDKVALGKPLTDAQLEIVKGLFTKDKTSEYSSLTRCVKAASELV